VLRKTFFAGLKNMSLTASDYPSIDPYSRGDIWFHVIGGVLNGVSTIAAILWLFLNWSALKPSWYLVLIAIAVGLFIVDFITGFLHWAFDAWFNENMTFIRRMVIMVREHHLYPERIFQFSFYHDAGILSWISLFLTSPLILYSFYWTGDPKFSRICYYGVCICVVVSLGLVFMLEFHKCGHNPRAAKWVRVLQRFHLLLSFEHHMTHHSGKYDKNYCLINGHADRTLGRLGVWRGLEWCITAVTGAVARGNDKEWLGKYRGSNGQTK
jgi:ubiquitin-conjugating enzyme E2 variant